jgi:hypothetical protein
MHSQLFMTTHALYFKGKVKNLCKILKQVAPQKSKLKQLLLHNLQ